MLGVPVIMKITTEKPSLPFDHVAAHEFLTKNDPHLADVVTRTGEFLFKLDECDSVYESLLEAIVHQSISGKAAVKIYSRIQALGANGVCPTPAEILETRIPALRKAGLSKAKALAMKDLAQKTIDGIVPTLDAAQKMSDEELVERLISVRGIGAWTVEMFLIFRLGRPGRAAHSRLGRAKRVGDYLPQAKNAKTKRASEIWRTLAPLSHHRQLVHVARRPPRRQRRPQNHQSPAQKRSAPRRTIPSKIRQQGIRP